MEAGWLKSRIEGAMYGGAVGDAIGGPVEGWTRDIIETFHGTREVTEMLPYFWKDKNGDSEMRAPIGKTTDDTHFKNLLCQAIVKKGGRVDAPTVVNTMMEYAPHHASGRSIFTALQSVRGRSRNVVEVLYSAHRDRTGVQGTKARSRHPTDFSSD